MVKLLFIPDTEENHIKNKKSFKETKNNTSKAI